MKNSLLVGISVVAGILLGSIMQWPVQVGAQEPKPSALQVGRFQMEGIPGHIYVLDTATGQVWEAFASANSGSSDGDFKSPKVKAQ